MFTEREIRLFEEDYFTVIRQEEKFVEVCSKPTGHQWIVFKESSRDNRPVTLYHKHAADTKYYHKHRCRAWTVKDIISEIKNHDCYVIENG